MAVLSHWIPPLALVAPFQQLHRPPAGDERLVRLRDTPEQHFSRAVDAVVAKEFAANVPSRVVAVNGVGDDEMILDAARVREFPARVVVVISDRERIMTAYHEAGHAIVSVFEPGVRGQVLKVRELEVAGQRWTGSDQAIR